VCTYFACFVLWLFCALLRKGGSKTPQFFPPQHLNFFVKSFWHRLFLGLFLFGLGLGLAIAKRTPPHRRTARSRCALPLAAVTLLAAG
jgi:hypothetical protein